MTDLEFRQTREEISVATQEFSGVRTVHQGLLPPPSDFAEYERTHPGTAGALVDAMEKALEHRMFCEREDLELRKAALEKENKELKLSIDAGASHLKITGRGQTVAVVVLLALLAATLGADALGTTWLSVGLFVLLTALFVVALAGAIENKS